MFIDQYPPASIMKFGFVSSPRFSTNITAVASGAERRNRNWAQRPTRRRRSAPDATAVMLVEKRGLETKPNFMIEAGG